MWRRLRGRRAYPATALVRQYFLPFDRFRRIHHSSQSRKDMSWPIAARVTDQQVLGLPVLYRALVILHLEPVRDAESRLHVLGLSLKSPGRFVILLCLDRYAGNSFFLRTGIVLLGRGLSLNLHTARLQFRDRIGW